MRRRQLLQAASLPLLMGCAGTAMRDSNGRARPSIRVATFNVSLHDNESEGLIKRLIAGDPAADMAAAVIRHQRPDILLLNEFDFDIDGAAADLFVRGVLRSEKGIGEPIHYPYWFRSPVNTGVPSGLDLNGDGRIDGPQDAWGFGTHEGQYGMLVLSQYPIDLPAVRTFQYFPWSHMPHARRPRWPDGREFYSDEIWQQLRLSSKSHWDVPVQTPLGTVHLLASHPTPPVFDGPENRNGCRNHDEIRLWADYLDPHKGTYLVDDQGRRGPLAANASAIVAGDLNADPHDGEAAGGLQLLLRSERLNASFTPTSRGAVIASRQQQANNRTQRGDPAADTGDFNDNGPGNLRVDHLIPTKDLRVIDGGVFWPAPDEPGAEWLAGSDHRMVWVDLAAQGPGLRAQESR